MTVEYSKRASTRSQPLSGRMLAPFRARPLAHTKEQGHAMAAAGTTFFADISAYQPPVDGSYPYPVLSFRADTGYGTDNNAKTNFARTQADPDILCTPVYVVYLPGQNAAIMARLRNLLGSQCPPKVVPMIDIESGAGFAGPGNHSAGANALAEMVADYGASRDRGIGYANRPDFASGWPQIVPWLKKHTASYGTFDPGTYAWQYFGGLTQYPSPAGFPRSCPPFGAWVDMNVIKRPVSQIVADFDLGVPPPPPTSQEPDMATIFINQDAPALRLLDTGSCVIILHNNASGGGAPVVKLAANDYQDLRNRAVN